VRRDHDLRDLEQRAGRGRLGDVDVDARTPDVPAAHGLGQRVLVDEATPRGIHDDHAGLGEGQLVLADQAEGLGGLREVDRDQLGAAEQLVERHQLDAQLRGAGRRDVGVVGDQLDAERGEALRHQLPDLAEAHDAGDLAVDLDAGERAAGPRARAQRGVRGRDVAGGGQHQRDGVLGGGDDVGGRGVHDHHAAGGGGGHVDVVEAHPRAGDDLEPGGRGERLGVDLRGGTDEEGVGVGDRGQERRAVGAVHVADLDVLTEQRDRGRRELLGEQDDRAGGGGAHGGQAPQ
jgi:hypothetical protein